MRKFVFAVILIVLATLGAAWYLGRHGYLRMSTPVQQNPEVVLQLEDVKIVGRNKGRKAWSIKADRVDVSRSRIRSTLYDIKDGVMYQDNKPAATFTAGRIDYNDANRNLEAAGGLRIVAKGDIEIKTQSASYDSWSSVLTCPQKVTLKTKKSAAQANSLVVNLKTNEVDAKGLQMRAEVSEVERLLENKESTDRGEQ